MFSHNGANRPKSSTTLCFRVAVPGAKSAVSDCTLFDAQHQSPILFTCTTSTFNNSIKKGVTHVLKLFDWTFNKTYKAMPTVNTMTSVNRFSIIHVNYVHALDFCFKVV